MQYIFNGEIKLKKLFTILAATALMASAYAKETITVINPSNKASPATVLAKSYEESLRGNPNYDVEFYQASSCTDAASKYAATKNAVMVVNADVNIAAMAKGISGCELQATAANTSLITKSYLKICRKTGSTKGFGDTPTTIGMASVILSDGLMKDLNGSTRSFKGVPYPGSKAVLGGVLSGDINYGIIGAGIAMPAAERKEVECVYDTDPKSNNFLGKALPDMKIPTMPIIQMVHTNATDKAVKDAISKAGQDDKFQTGIKSHGFLDTKTGNIADSDVGAVNDFINKAYNTYWKK